jgi:hypothetical protein
VHGAYRGASPRSASGRTYKAAEYAFLVRANQGQHATITALLTLRSRFLLEKLIVTQLVKHGISLPCSQEPVTGPCQEPDECTPHTSYFFKIHFNIILPSTFKSSLQVYRLNAVCICVSDVRSTCPHPSFGHPNKIWRSVRVYLTILSVTE